MNLSEAGLMYVMRPGDNLVVWIKGCGGRRLLGFDVEIGQFADCCSHGSARKNVCGSWMAEKGCEIQRMGDPCSHMRTLQQGP